MHHEIRDNQLYLHRLPEEKERLIQRLNRIEGQVRGLHRMIENDRYCGDVVQQASAICAPVREVTLQLISQYAETGIPLVSENGGPMVPSKRRYSICFGAPSVIQGAASEPVEPRAASQCQISSRLDIAMRCRTRRAGRVLVQRSLQTRGAPLCRDRRSPVYLRASRQATYAWGSPGSRINSRGSGSSLSHSS
jgi:CsoR family transcriptional regulator, copper-sensing transcriptional repressor